MKKIAVIHFMPLEYYPPITNILDVLGKEENLNIKVWSTKNIKKRVTYANTQIISINRTVLPKPQQNRLLRLFYYLYFNLKVWLDLVIFNPDDVVYFETYSAGPVYWYFKSFGKFKRLFIHYHEYFDQKWYDKGMTLVKKYYEYEKRFLLKKANWISHTNSFRIELFHDDHPDLQTSKLKVLQNYPPKKWLNKANFDSKEQHNHIKTVYVGSLSLKDTFIKEYCNWVIEQKGEVTFDIYAYNLHEDTKRYLTNLKSAYISYYQNGIEYNLLPKILSKYEIGIILYKGNTKNYIYNAPNKLFEYLACGLNVWFPNVMKGCKDYINQKSRPLILEKDFTNLNVSDISNHKKALNLPFQKNEYFCEVELQPLIIQLKS